MKSGGTDTMAINRYPDGSIEFVDLAGKTQRYHSNQGLVLLFSTLEVLDA